MPDARSILRLFAVSGAAWMIAGCGGVLYTAKINAVEAKVENAKELGAEASAPYEYYSARERVQKAKEEASRADYQDAVDLLDEAETFADKAVAQAGAVRRGAGR
ncbi:MAG: DUF4398 domain-containing protein [Polyangiales bacterium]